MAESTPRDPKNINETSKLKTQRYGEDWGGEGWGGNRKEPEETPKGRDIHAAADADPSEGG